jgi:Fe-S-cluster containining protein
MTKFCSNCGLCCMHMRTPPFIQLGPDAARWNALPPLLRLEIHEWVSGNPSPRWQLMNNDDGPINPCLWLDLKTGDCRHYEWRPDACRDYEVGCKSYRRLRKEVGLTVKGMPLRTED